MFETIRSTQELFASFKEQRFEELGDVNFSLQDYENAYLTARQTYLDAAEAVKKASRDAYVAAAATYTKSLYS
ncbi:hypothetical protein GUITHDRAFT_114695 [Guillardia theta CCMP2712]|uniref:BAR domain-containing protein n=1 Tax=Guillardia theta (strain CCMP2712) TaxID=905079 RepID=L1ISL7_GUITC|nr:hypothetical protein GUITHDRAFT_114695 [Guillardia theta CCMP2712]EKX39261.1 hypothetical protein GUITHDRAFT_114695 [Guillardia theta CCMP2712]|eukprot:XP_005826241.1 hypothetical protein GUITHDRAFT_114695 [Guillardia theta CCMP2712]